MIFVVFPLSPPSYRAEKTRIRVCAPKGAGDLYMRVCVLLLLLLLSLSTAAGTRIIIIFYVYNIYGRLTDETRVVAMDGEPPPEKGVTPTVHVRPSEYL